MSRHLGVEKNHSSLFGFFVLLGDRICSPGPGLLLLGRVTNQCPCLHLQTQTAALSILGPHHKIRHCLGKHQWGTNPASETEGHLGPGTRGSGE